MKKKIVYDDNNDNDNKNDDDAIDSNNINNKDDDNVNTNTSDSVCNSKIKISRDSTDYNDVILETINHNGHYDYIVKRIYNTGNIQTELLIERLNTKYHTEKERLIDYYDNGRIVYQLNNNIVNSTIKTTNGEYFMTEPININPDGLNITDLLERKSHLMKNILCGNNVYVALTSNGNSVMENAKCLDINYDNDGVSAILLKNENGDTSLAENFKDLEVQVAVKENNSFMIVIASGVITQIKYNGKNIKYAIIENLEIPHLTCTLQIPSTSTENNNIEIDIKV